MFTSKSYAACDKQIMHPRYMCLASLVLLVAVDLQSSSARALTGMATVRVYCVRWYEHMILSDPRGLHTARLKTATQVPCNMHHNPYASLEN